MKTIMIIGMMALTFGAIAQKEVKTIEIKSSTVCGMCEDKIEHDLKFEKGVRSVDVNLDSNLVVVQYQTDKTSPMKIKLALTKIGYSADNLPANPKAFKRLPGCCKSKEACESEHHGHEH